MVLRLVHYIQGGGVDLTADKMTDCGLHCRRAAHLRQMRPVSQEWVLLLVKRGGVDELRYNNSASCILNRYTILIHRICY